MRQDSNPNRLRVRVLTDGRAANLTQALGLAEAIARRVAAEIECFEAHLPKVLDALPSALLAALPFRVFADPRVLAPGEGVDLALGAGRRGNLAAAQLRRRLGCAAVALLDPHLGTGAFSLVVVPEHDRTRGTNVVTSLGALHRLTPEALAAAPRPFPDLPRPRLAVLIGGPSRTAPFGAGEAEGLLADLGRFAGWSLQATPSRRTPTWLAPRLRAARPDLRLWDGAGPNPWPGLLAAADAVLVTADSVSMASEATASGRPLFISGAAPPGSKHARFHAALFARGLARPASAAPVLWQPPGLDEAGRIAALVLDRLGFS
jgi:mitochondrial fission protein ELM1